MTHLLPFPAFLKAPFRAPRTIGAIAPSGAHLARLMTSEIEPGAGKVLELGPGTGVFTQAILDRGLKRRDLTLIEIDQKFTHLLGRRFGNIDIMCCDACDLQAANAGRGSYASVVSGLPLRNMPEEVIEAIPAGAFAILNRGGAFYQFTYGRFCSVPDEVLERLSLKATSLGRVRLNVPPASVFRLSRRER
ncbi:SAM-dependent methyltransferase [Rhizobium sp. Root1203]|uniref:class I SAM-dependent methyltransferase n=1 Tax=Rhizobium sp. Root1203 TaxID=1736427 RepID=UPI00070B893D|nr:methyltransferase domain-containing protein [Rhizobium sp. Root1203]KQV27149.1 SAM-dependent methyltransferase [Rhizobium sp. Root1203]